MSPVIAPPLALYVHFPWCVRKCPYCDFNSHTLHGELPQDRYTQALELDIETQAEQLRGRPLASIFLGGGTPSLFGPEAIARVLGAASKHFAVSENLEVTMEANPGAVERGRFAEYSAAGVTRVSLGAQSFNARALQALGRIHSPDETVRAAEELHAAGLANFNLDLMYALPGQTIDAAVADVDRALELRPAHLSHYQLTIEAGTVFAASPPALPADDTAASMLSQCRERLLQAGFSQYEVSAYSLPQHACRHNLNYWTFGDYIGAGAGAHGKLTLSNGIFRTAQLREPRRYLAADPRLLERKPVAAADLPFEFMLNALRLVEGFDAQMFEERTGLAWDHVEGAISGLKERNLLASTGACYRPTDLGMRFLNDLMIEFLPEKAVAPRLSEMSTAC